MFGDAIAVPFGIAIQTGAWCYDVRVTGIPSSAHDNRFAAIGWSSVEYRGAWLWLFSLLCCTATTMFRRVCAFAGNPLTEPHGISSYDGLFAGVVVFGSSVRIIVDGVEVESVAIPDKETEHFDVTCYVAMVPDGSSSVAFAVDGKRLSSVVPVPTAVTALRPYLVSQHPSTLTIDFGAATSFAAVGTGDGSPLPPRSLREFVFQAKQERVLRIAQHERFALGKLVGRWAREGLLVTPLVGTDLYHVQRSSVPATKRFTFITAFIPGMCLNSGAYAYEVRSFASCRYGAWSLYLRMRGVRGCARCCV